MGLSKRLAVAGLVFCLAGGTGCISGAIFQYTTVPIDVNLDETPAHTGERGPSWKTFVIPYPLRMQFHWGSTAIGDAIRYRGLTTVHYADLRTLSVLGLWTQRWVYVYGE